MAAIFQEDVYRFVRSAIDAEAANEFWILRRVPNTRAWKTVDYILRLPARRRSSLYDDFACVAMDCFLPTRQTKLHPYRAGSEEYRAYCDGVVGFVGWQFEPVRFLRAAVSARRDDPMATFGMSDAMLKQVQEMRTTKAPEMRKTIKRIFAQRFGARAENQGGGDWQYVGEWEGRGFAVRIDYGHRFGTQLEYEVKFSDPATGLTASRLSYESFLGMGFGNWDYLTADNLEDAAVLLADLIEGLVSIPDRLATTSRA